ncbi:cx9C motif-containing protein 4 [Protopterus annectens]|uniref:cx9C motif-containing protein 4 n=1 Tax=Protopterus annectens TaxID=7888 RepID=UPI001CFB15B0|nr:cx9C motif-containing protein 4 [Protopterus annectens]
MPPKDPCQKQACEIQKCLQANNYLEEKCQAVIREMKKCCLISSAKDSVCCSGFEKETEQGRSKSASVYEKGKPTLDEDYKNKNK